MQIGDKIKLRNKAGILTVDIVKELNRPDVFRCIGDDRLPAMAKPRLEVHKNKHSETILITLCDQKSDGPPYDIYIIEILPYEEYQQVYLGKFNKTEQPDDVFETMEGWI